MSSQYDLIGKLAQYEHLIVLKDWLIFLQQPPQKIVLYSDLDQAKVEQDLKSSGYTGTLILMPFVEGDDLKNDETSILEKLVAQCSAEIYVSINLDTLAYTSEKNWLPEIIDDLMQNKYQFLTGCGIIFKADQPIEGTEYLKTQRFSYNFCIMKKTLWQEIMDEFRDADIDESIRRFHCEWAIEQGLLKYNYWGRRRLDSMHWRVFHVQEWGPRMKTVRSNFIAGKGIKSYANKIYENTRHPWEQYYDFPKPNLLKRMRIWLGEKRRRLLSAN